MSLAPKIFISYSSKDRPLSIRLWQDLTKSGAEVWQYDESAQPGADAWDPILKQIEVSDFFLILVSQASISSAAVLEEIDHAHYSRINHGGQKPTIIPIILERVDVPRKIIRFGRLDLSQGNYESGLTLLLRTIGISESSPKKQASGFRIIEPGIGLNEVKVGDAKENLLREFGSPSSDDGEEIRYYDAGVDALLVNDRILSLFFYFKTPHRSTFDGSTREGIGFISKVSDVLRVYGKPERNVESIVSEPGTPPNATHLFLHYLKKGLTFSFYDDELASIEIYAPTDLS